MIFPRPITIHEGGCISFTRFGRSGKPVQFDDLQCQDNYRGVKFEGEDWGAHRLSYHLNHSPIPRCPPAHGIDNVLHTCDHKWCIAKDHLYLGDAKQNAIDNATRNEAWRKNRSEAQKKIGFPKVSAEGRLRRAEANREHMKKLWAEKPEEMKERIWGSRRKTC